MKKAVLVLALIFGMAGLARAQQKWTLSAAASSCTTSNTSCLIYLVDAASGGATFTVGANASANTLQFEASGDGGTTWVAFNVTPSNGSTAVTSTTSTGTWQANVAGYTAVRIRMSTLVSGTATVSIITSIASARAGGGGGAGSFPVEPANTVFAGPSSGASANPTFRSLVLADVPCPANSICASAAKYNLPVTGYTSCNATLSNGSNIVQTNTSDPVFTAAMVGWIIMANSQACQSFDNSGVNRFPTTSTTITGFTDAHHVTTSSNANGSCTTSGQPSCNIGWFPADSQSALQSAWNDALAAGVCAQLIIPAGYYAVGSAITNSTNPAPCGLTISFGATSDTQSAGVSGQGIFSTTLVPLPSFSGTGCTAVEGSQKVCLFGSFQNVGPKFNDFSVDGLGFNTPASMSGTCVLGVNYLGQVDNVQVVNFAGSLTANDSALCINSAAQGLTSIHAFWCYAGGFHCITGISQFSVVNSISVNLGIGLNITSAGQVASTGNEWATGGTGATCNVSVVGNLTSTGDQYLISGNSRSNVCPQPSSRINIVGATMAGGTFSGGFGGNFFFNNTGTETVYVSGSKMTATGAGSAFSTNGTGPNTFIDGCGNSFSTTATFTNINYVPCWQGSALSNTPLTLSGTGACSARSTQTGTGWKGTITCTSTTGASTLVITPGVNANIPVQGGTGWQCSGSDITTVADVLTQSADSATTCTLNATAIAANDVIVFQASPF